MTVSIHLPFLLWLMLSANLFFQVWTWAALGATQRQIAKHIESGL